MNENICFHVERWRKMRGADWRIAFTVSYEKPGAPYAVIRTVERSEKHGRSILAMRGSPRFERYIRQASWTETAVSN